ncbi:T9SS type A sorting domain-containing protein [Bacteroidota bacterium]
MGSILPVLKVESNTNSNGILRLKGGGTGSLNWNIYTTGSGSTEGAGKLVIGDGIHGEGTGVDQKIFIYENGDIEVSKPNSGIILTSTSGTKFKITVDESGNLTTTEYTGIKSVSAETEIELFPNPTDNLLNINVVDQNIKDIDAEIYDLTGRMIFMKNYKSNSFEINTTDLTSGTYLIKLKDSDGNLLKTEKFMKE